MFALQFSLGLVPPAAFDNLTVAWRACVDEMPVWAIHGWNGMYVGLFVCLLIGLII